ncbi:hypothetical protein [Streptomyces virginiae]
MAEFEANERELATGRDILRKAAKYFAGGDELVTSRFQSSTTTGTHLR